MSVRKTVGVLGGFGPAATVDFFDRVLKATPASRDQDHLRLIIDNNPLAPDRNAAIAGTGPSPGPALAAMAQGLERAGADFLVMPCNTAHAFQAEIEAATRLPFVSLISETVKATRAERPDARRVGVLATSGCLTAGLYPKAFAAEGVDTVVPEGELLERFMTLIYAIKAGDTGPAARAEMAAIGQALVDQGAQALIAGCTEVPLVLGAHDAAVPLISSTDVLVARTVAYALGEPLPVR
ncbi:amino acid racemase [Caulobacter sp. 17J65-9]|uniref:amino acid racemase n=1 Tax=Caulobacter sp. 17J65-9 TaxID=2709382 RepID=UPI0013C79FEC|nr:amino acid racemase [Caulobacter sp. 17J65-9]